MSSDSEIIVIEPADVGTALEAVLLVLIRRVRADPVLQRQIADALAPVVTLAVTTSDPPRSWFDSRS